MVILLWWKQDQQPAMCIACVVTALSFLATLAFNQIFLLFIDRIRPYDASSANCSLRQILIGRFHRIMQPPPQLLFRDSYSKANEVRLPSCCAGHADLLFSVLCWFELCFRHCRSRDHWWFCGLVCCWVVSE